MKIYLEALVAGGARITSDAEFADPLDRKLSIDAQKEACIVMVKQLYKNAPSFRPTEITLRIEE